MLAVVIIAVSITGISAAIAWGATRGKLGGLTNALETQTPVGRKVINSLLVVIYVGCGIVLPIIFLVGNHDSASARVGGVKLFCDGSASERTMRMSQPYVGRPNDYGILVTTRDRAPQGAMAVNELMRMLAQMPGLGTEDATSPPPRRPEGGDSPRPKGPSRDGDSPPPDDER